jgi:hypothetical protein
MKKLIALFVLISSLSTISCNKKDEETATPDLLIGRWYYVATTTVLKTKAEAAPATKRTAATAPIPKTVKYLEFKNGGVYSEGYQTGTVAADNATYSYSKTDNCYLKH